MTVVGSISLRGGSRWRPSPGRRSWSIGARWLVKSGPNVDGWLSPGHDGNVLGDGPVNRERRGRYCLPSRAGGHPRVGAAGAPGHLDAALVRIGTSAYSLSWGPIGVEPRALSGKAGMAGSSRRMPRAEGAELDSTAIALAAGVVVERWPETLIVATMSPRAIRLLAIKGS
jgi:hypothetical protein